MSRLSVLLSVYIATPPAPYVKAVGSSLSLHGNSSSTICQGCRFFSQSTWQLLQHHMSRLSVLLSVYMATPPAQYVKAVGSSLSLHSDSSSTICQGCRFFSQSTWQLLQHHMSRLSVLLSVYIATPPAPMSRLSVLLSVYMATPPAPYVNAVGSSLSLHGNSSSTICQGCRFFSQSTWQLLQHHMSRLSVLLSVYMATPPAPHVKAVGSSLSLHSDSSSTICQGCRFFSQFTWQLLQHHMSRLSVLLSVYMATPPAPYVKAVGSSLSLHVNSSSTICQGCRFFSQFT